MRRTIGFVAIVVAVASVMAMPAHAAPSPQAGTPPAHDGTARTQALAAPLAATSVCPVIVTDFRLSSDLDCDLTVAATGVTVDLGRHTLNGSIFGDTDVDFVVRNGTVHGSIIATSSNVKLDSLIVRDATDFAVQLGGGSVTRSAFFGNSVALDLFWGGGITVTHSWFIGNNTGIVNGQDSGSIIDHNIFIANDTGILVWDEDLFGSNDVHVTKNAFINNDDTIEVRAAADVDRLLISHNRLIHNSVGGIAINVDCIEEGVCGADGLLVTKNMAFGNGQASDGRAGDGISALGVQAGLAKVTVTKNIAGFNADLGIDAAGVVDGGGNKAFFNGDVRQCVGVVCR